MLLLEGEGVTLRCLCFDLDDTLHNDGEAYRRAVRATCETAAADHCPEVPLDDLIARYVEVSDAFWAEVDVAPHAFPAEEIRRAVWRRALASFGRNDPDLDDRGGKRGRPPASLSCTPGIG